MCPIDWNRSQTFEDPSLRRDHRIFVGPRVSAFESTGMREVSPTAT
jgi:hypothetical protein